MTKVLGLLGLLAQGLALAGSMVSLYKGDHVMGVLLLLLAGQISLTIKLED